MTLSIPHHRCSAPVSGRSLPKGQRTWLDTAMSRCGGADRRTRRVSLSSVFQWSEVLPCVILTS